MKSQRALTASLKDVRPLLMIAAYGFVPVQTIPPEPREAG